MQPRTNVDEAARCASNAVRAGGRRFARMRRPCVAALDNRCVFP
ncbi:hypothetical protein Y047_6071 [Burkholderia pseudomallei MSHR3016]|nr:hypothetical protein Y047_6071 [Burkholderia pseudomallei MSHR3016]